MRHGEASWHASSDAERPLTENGVLRLRAALHDVQDRIDDIDLLIHSPYLRTTQTADIVCETLSVAQREVDSFWVPEANQTQALASLEAYTDQTLMVVTHNPLVSHLVGAICGTGIEPFDPGTIAAVDLEWPAEGLGTVVWKR